MLRSGAAVELESTAAYAVAGQANLQLIPTDAVPTGRQKPLWREARHEIRAEDDAKVRGPTSTRAGMDWSTAICSNFSRYG